MALLDPFMTRRTIVIVVALWAFACVMANLGSFLQGHTPLGQLLTYLPSAGSAIGLNLLLIGAVSRARHLPRPVQAGVVILALAIVSVGQTVLDLIYVRSLAVTLFPGWKSWALDFSMARVSFILILYTWTYLVSMVMVWASTISDASQATAARASALEAATYRAEAAALRLQLNPHFLFNTLNSIASLTVTGRTEAAERMIGLLAEFLRSSLSIDPNAEVPVSSEVANALAYLRIEEVRFGDRLQVVAQVSDPVRDVLVPNFVLQPLAENAVKHGVASRDAKTRIIISAEREGDDVVLAVANEQIGETARIRKSTGGDVSHGLGLSTLRRRLKLVYADAARLETIATESGYRAEVRLASAGVAS